MKIPTHMTQHSFSQVPRASIERSQFNRSFGVKTTFNAGYLIPVFVDEALPGDTFVVKMSALARLATPVKPIMDNIYLDTFFFAVPLRLVWANFTKFMGEQDNPGDSTDFTIPQCRVPGGGYGIHTVEDYFGLPTLVGDSGVGVRNWEHSALPSRAYYRIWNEWFRDENLQDSISRGRETGDGPDVAYDPGSGNPGGSQVMRRGKRHDYFTSCLPWPQKGEVATMPLGDYAPVVSDETMGGIGKPLWQKQATPQNPISLVSGTAGDFPTATRANLLGSSLPDNGAAMYWHTTALVADLGGAQSITINALRQAFQIQKLLERDARGGTRYTELVRAHFGVVSPDARLQRPEYLGGGTSPVIVNPIAQTSASGEYAESPQGNLAAMGTAHISGHGFAKSFTEHSIVIGMICARADLTYQQGMERMWSRKTKYDFYWPALSHIGEQAVLNKEIYVQDDAGANNEVFGYQERYAEYRYKPSIITGSFRSAFQQSLDYWHLAQDFATLPTLSEDFIVENPPIDRVVAVPSEPQFLADIYFNFKAARPMPVYGVPGLIDHF